MVSRKQSLLFQLSLVSYKVCMFLHPFYQQYTLHFELSSHPKNISIGQWTAVNQKRLLTISEQLQVNYAHNETPLSLTCLTCVCLVFVSEHINGVYSTDHKQHIMQLQQCRHHTRLT